MYLFVLMFCMAFAAPPSPSTNYSAEQLRQEIVPLLQGEIESLHVRIASKRAFFSGTKSFEQAFWDIAGQDLLRKNTRSSLQRTIYVENKQRLSNRFSYVFPPDLENETKQKYEQLHEEKWNKQNEMDALNLQLIQKIQVISAPHETYLASLFAIEDRNTQILGQENTTEDNLAVEATAQQQYLIQRLKSALLQQWLNQNNTPMEELASWFLASSLSAMLTIEQQEESLTLLLPWLTSEEHTTQAASLKEIISTQKEVLYKEEQEKKWNELQVQWPQTIENWSEEEAKKELVALEEKKKNIDATQLRHIQYQIDTLQHHIQVHSGIRTQAELLASQAKLEEAKQKELEENRNAEQSRIQKEVIRIREEETRLRTNELTRHEEIQKRWEALTEESSQIDAEYKKWLDLAPLDPNKESLFLSHRLRCKEQKQHIQDIILELESLPSPVPMTTQESHPLITQALSDISEAQQDQSAHIHKETQDLFSLWIHTTEHLDRLHKQEPEDFDGEEAWSSIQFEWNRFFLIWDTHFTRLHTWIQDVNHVFVLFRFLVWGAIIVSIWRWLKNKLIPSWIWLKQWLQRQERLNISHVLGEENTISEATSSFLFQLYFLLSALFLHSYFANTLLSIITASIVLLMGLRLTRPLAILLSTEKDLQESLHQGIKMFVVAFLGLNILQDLTKKLFFAYQSAELVHGIQKIILLGIFLLQLGNWSVFVQKKAEETVGLMFWKNIMERMSTGIIGSRIRSCIALIILLLDLMSRIIFWSIENSSLLGSTLARNTLEDTASENDGLVSFDSTQWHIEQKEMLSPYLNHLQEGIREWSTDKKRGSFVITADEGMGATLLLSLLSQEQHTHPIHPLHTNTIIRDTQWNKEALLAWLITSLGIETNTIREPNVIIEILKKRTPTIFVLDQLQNLFLRVVEGFVILDTLFAIIQETSNTHCWILTCHQPTWRFITSTAAPIQSNFFRSEITIKPWSVHQIKEHFRIIIDQNSYALDFSSLTSLHNPQAIYRAEMAYWRLLTDASKGNPSTALSLFRLSLFQSNSEQQTLFIKLFPLMDTKTIHELHDMDCFVLASIALHQSIRHHELCLSLLLNPETIRSICKNLVEKDMVRNIDGRYSVQDIWYPWVEGFLLQKRFLSMRA